MAEHVRDPYGRPHWREEAPAEIAEAEFLRLVDAAQTALNALDSFWTRLYGPNEALSGAHEALLEMDREFFGRDDEV